MKLLCLIVYTTLFNDMLVFLFENVWMVKFVIILKIILLIINTLFEQGIKVLYLLSLKLD